ncbi:MAG: hypothetical protein QXT28_11235 [Thermofilaceae archaeon]
MRVVLKDYRGRGVAFEDSTIYFIIGAEVGEEVEKEKLRVLAETTIGGRRIVVATKT